MARTKAKARPANVAREFCRVLYRWIGAEKVAEAAQRNAAEKLAGVCHTHDFCDANMAMAEAFKRVAGHECVPDSQDDADLWNASWNMAKGAELKPWRLPR